MDYEVHIHFGSEATFDGNISKKKKTEAGICVINLTCEVTGSSKASNLGTQLLCLVTTDMLFFAQL